MIYCRPGNHTDVSNLLLKVAITLGLSQNKFMMLLDLFLWEFSSFKGRVYLLYGRPLVIIYNKKLQKVFFLRSPKNLIKIGHHTAGLYASFLKWQGHQGIFFMVKPLLKGKKILLEHFEGLKAMTRGHGGNHPLLVQWSIRSDTGWLIPIGNQCSLRRSVTWKDLSD